MAEPIKVLKPPGPIQPGDVFLEPGGKDQEPTLWIVQMVVDAEEILCYALGHPTDTRMAPPKEMTAGWRKVDIPELALMLNKHLDCSPATCNVTRLLTD